MKYKVKDSAGRQALLKLVMGKRDWILWYGTYKDQCYQVQGLIRYTPADRSHANCIDNNGNYLRCEQLTFQSRKAVVRYVRKHKLWLIEDYKKRNAGRVPHCVLATHWHCNGTICISLTQ